MCQKLWAKATEHEFLITIKNAFVFCELKQTACTKSIFEVSIIGCGGIKSGSDAFEFLLVGANAVQVGTAFEKEGSDCFKRINKELEYILQKKRIQKHTRSKWEIEVFVKL